MLISTIYLKIHFLNNCQNCLLRGKPSIKKKKDVMKNEKIFSRVYSRSIGSSISRGDGEAEKWCKEHFL